MSYPVFTGAHFSRSCSFIHIKIDELFLTATGNTFKWLLIISMLKLLTVFFINNAFKS
jgi:hypothetical protein